MVIDAEKKVEFSAFVLPGKIDIVFEEPVVFVDIETTGGGYRTSRVLEVAALRYENGEVAEEFSSLINPGVRVPEFITGITGITDADVADAPSFREVAQQLGEVLDGAVFIAHNVNFDYSFIKAEFARIGIPYNAKKLCTVRLSRYLYGQSKGHSLEKLIARHDIPFRKRHRALDDAKAILYFAELAFKEHGPEVFRTAITRQLRTQYATATIEPEIIRNLETGPGVYIFKDKEGTVLYVGKSINIRTRVRSHFQDASAKEVKLTQRTAHIETIPTGNEMLALLLESRLIKELSPVFNRQLRRVSRYCMVLRRQNEAGYPEMIYAQGAPGSVDQLSDIYAVHETTVKAKKWMDIHSRTFDLCPKLMGLEKSKGACFWYSLKKCRGACIGEEPAERYEERLNTALEKSRFMDWPHEGAVTIADTENDTEVTVDRWTVTSIKGKGAEFFKDKLSNFDYDEYKILKQFIIGA